MALITSDCVPVSGRRRVTVELGEQLVVGQGGRERTAAGQGAPPPGTQRINTPTLGVLCELVCVTTQFRGARLFAHKGGQVGRAVDAVRRRPVGRQAAARKQQVECRKSSTREWPRSPRICPCMTIVQRSGRNHLGFGCRFTAAAGPTAIGPTDQARAVAARAAAAAAAATQHSLLGSSVDGSFVPAGGNYDTAAARLAQSLSMAPPSSFTSNWSSKATTAADFHPRSPAPAINPSARLRIFQLREVGAGRVYEAQQAVGLAAQRRQQSRGATGAIGPGSSSMPCPIQAGAVRPMAAGPSPLTVAWAAPQPPAGGTAGDVFAR